MSKIKVNVFKVRTPDGKTENVTIFCGEDGYVTGVAGADLLARVGKGAASNLSLSSQFVVTNEVKNNMKFFSELSPCWFPECESLRLSYKRELTQLESKANCPACEKGALIRKYLQLISLSVNSPS